MMIYYPGRELVHQLIRFQKNHLKQSHPQLCNLFKHIISDKVEEALVLDLNTFPRLKRKDPIVNMTLIDFKYASISH